MAVRRTGDGCQVKTRGLAVEDELVLLLGRPLDEGHGLIPPLPFAAAKRRSALTQSQAACGCRTARFAGSAPGPCPSTSHLSTP